jgi:DNA-binding NarL/FixJ family response regulator
MELIRTLLVDDSLEFLEASQRFIASDPEIEIVGTATSGKEAIQKVIQLQPDLVLMDITMPGLNGLEATRKIKALSDPPQVIILTLYDHPEYQAASEAVRADGFVSKSDFGSGLLKTIHQLFEETMIVEP